MTGKEFLNSLANGKSDIIPINKLFKEEAV